MAATVTAKPTAITSDTATPRATSVVEVSTSSPFDGVSLGNRDVVRDNRFERTCNDPNLKSIRPVSDTGFVSVKPSGSRNGDTVELFTLLA